MERGNHTKNLTGEQKIISPSLFINVLGTETSFELQAAYRAMDESKIVLKLHPIGFLCPLGNGRHQTHKTTAAHDTGIKWTKKRRLRDEKHNATAARRLI